MIAAHSGTWRAQCLLDSEVGKKKWKAAQAEQTMLSGHDRCRWVHLNRAFSGSQNHLGFLEFRKRRATGGPGTNRDA